MVEEPETRSRIALGTASGPDLPDTAERSPQCCFLWRPQSAGPGRRNGVGEWLSMDFSSEPSRPSSKSRALHVNQTITIECRNVAEEEGRNSAGVLQSYSL